jgi:hypothetical protein
MARYSKRSTLALQISIINSIAILLIIIYLLIE